MTCMLPGARHDCELFAGGPGEQPRLRRLGRLPHILGNPVAQSYSNQEVFLIT